MDTNILSHIVSVVTVVLYVNFELYTPNMQTCMAMVLAMLIYHSSNMVCMHRWDKKFAFEEKNALKVNEEKKKNKNNNYLSLTAYCVAWNQEEWWIEWNHSQNRKLFFFYLFMGALKIGCFCDGCVFLINLNEHEKFSQMFQPQTKQLQISVMGSIHSKYYSIFFFIYFYLFALHTFLCVLVGYSAT